MKRLLLAAICLATVFAGFTSSANAWVVVYHYHYRVVYHRPVVVYRPVVQWHYVYWYYY